MKDLIRKVLVFLNPKNVETITDKVGTAITLIATILGGLLAVLGG